MGLETIEQEIVDIVTSKANQKISEASKKAEELIEETKKQAGKEEERIDKETEKIISQIKNIIESSSKFEIKKLSLVSKKEMLCKVFAHAEKEIASLNDETQERLTKILLDKAEKEICIEFVFCNEKTRKWVPKKYNVNIVPMLGGIIAETKDTTLRVDYRYETILEEIRKEAMQKIAKEIF